MLFVYFSGYLCRTLSEEDEESTFYNEKFGAYMRNLDRGGLKLLNDRCCQWTVYYFVIFGVVKIWHVRNH